MGKLFLGIDAGSVSSSIIVIDDRGEIIYKDYQFHRGQSIPILSNMLPDKDTQKEYYFTGTLNFSQESNYQIQDEKICAFETSLYLKEKGLDFDSILIIGGEKFGLIELNRNGDYKSYTKNTSCAAGTGSFLDQQSVRLQLKNSSELDKLAQKNKKEIPSIASRCAVFAKTDLIHAQQEGYSLEQITDSLTYGLAKNIADTVFKSHQKNISKVLVLGGVAKMSSVLTHLNKITEYTFITHEIAPYFGSFGSAYALMRQFAASSVSYSKLPVQSQSVHYFKKFLKSIHQKKEYHYPPLELVKTEYPDFSSLEQIQFQSKGSFKVPVEIDLYEDFWTRDNESSFHLGIDIGSTSTKAVLIDSDSQVIAGFYTRTSGTPLKAVSVIFEAIDYIGIQKKKKINILTFSTTGSGRKFIGETYKANIILDEITAHAKAAYHLNPQIDTIIEIGGQDAKFTTMKDGLVTLSIMNNVCAAGTGSFIEELASRLGVSTKEYSERVWRKESPLTSDRCTVFMERDINQIISMGYSVDEALTGVLHAVRENYLSKVARTSSIGNYIAFQGATAKNKALVAAFEQKLNKPIYVSKFCHLTGAIGAALHSIEKHRFEFVKNMQREDLFQTSRKNIQVHTEVCDLCNNQCKITVAEIPSENPQEEFETIAYGFLCGRDYETKKYVHDDTQKSFDSLKILRKIEKQNLSVIKKNTRRNEIQIGIPYSLHLVEDYTLWKNFFHQLGFSIHSPKIKKSVSEGKKVTGTELCAPMVSLHGHSKIHLEEADYVFLPFYFENTDHWQKPSGQKLDIKLLNSKTQRDIRRQFCYYTQFAPSMISGSVQNSEKLLTPLVRSGYSSFFTKKEIYLSLKKIKEIKVSFMEVSKAYDSAKEIKKNIQKKLIAQTINYLNKENPSSDHLKVLLLGRPYLINSEEMNAGIPDKIKTYHADVLTMDSLDEDSIYAREIEPLLKELHWNFAAKILQSTLWAAKSKDVYPVYVTSFMCSPDSFTLDYFRQIMDAYKKPYLILQLDEHDSGVGYDTRIEAAIRTFRNHLQKKELIETQFVMKEKTFLNRELKINPKTIHNDSVHMIKDRTILFPNWDGISSPLIVSVLKKEGYDVRLMHDTPQIIKNSTSMNNGQCLPLNILAESYKINMEKMGLLPQNSVLWVIDSSLACNIKMYAHQIQNVIETENTVMKDTRIYAGDITFIDFGIRISMQTYWAYMFGGLLRKISNKIRPYEKNYGETDRVLNDSIELLKDVFFTGKDKLKSLEFIIDQFENISVQKQSFPRVAIFGDIYARDNDIVNQGLIRYIEKNGGEVVSTPYSDYVKMVAKTYFTKWKNEKNYGEYFTSKMILGIIKHLEKKYYRIFNRILNEPMHLYNLDPAELLSPFNVRPDHMGESSDNLLKIRYLKKYYPDLSLLVQTNPVYCCAGLVTEAMKNRIEEVTGIPMVTISYDGTEGIKNDVLLPYLKYANKININGEKKIKPAQSNQA